MIYLLLSFEDREFYVFALRISTIDEEKKKTNFKVTSLPDCREKKNEEEEPLE